MNNLPLLIKTNTGTWIDAHDIRSLTTSNGFYRVFVYSDTSGSYYPISEATFNNIIERFNLGDMTSTALVKTPENEQIDTFTGKIIGDHNEINS